MMSAADKAERGAHGALAREQHSRQRIGIKHRGIVSSAYRQQRLINSSMA